MNENVRVNSKKCKTIKSDVRVAHAITLISLVITIVVLIILASVAIYLSLGNNGIFTRARQAREVTNKQEATEIINLKITTAQMNKYAEKQEMPTLKELSEVLRDDSEIQYVTENSKVASAEYDVPSTNPTLIYTKLNKYPYEFEINNSLQIARINGVKVEINQPTFTTVANAPDISGFNKNNTYYVSWDLTSNPYTINESTAISGTTPNNWYDYTEGVNHYANVKTTGGGNDCYWVWIPRYAYKVPTKGGTAETIEVKFLKDKTNKPIDGTEEITNTTPTPGTWVVHPAFTNRGNGGLGDLTGIWVAKYEASSSNVNTINLENETLKGDTNSLNGTGGGEDLNLKVRVKPNVTSWRNINANGIYTVCKNLTTNGNSLEGTTMLDSHMMKNTEWGAVAYLSSSKYGKADSSGNRVLVYNNPYYDATSMSTITGVAGATATQINKNTTTNLYIYNTREGVEASTTGNVYGIYDMVGGSFEYVAGIYKGGTSNDNCSILWDTNNLKYVDQYEKNYENTDKYGDAVYETSSSGNSFSDSWDGAFSRFPISNSPMFVRGTVANCATGCTLFAFDRDSGKGTVTYTFRPVVVNFQE